MFYVVLTMQMTSKVSAGTSEVSSIICNNLQGPLSGTACYVHQKLILKDEIDRIRTAE